MNSSERKYYEWLLDIIKPNQPSASYWLLVRMLHDNYFHSIVPNDDNRCADGIDLRNKFAEETEYARSSLGNTPCTILEMLIGLAFRMTDIMYDIEEKETDTAKWFWIMLDNAGLKKFNDDNYDVFEIKEIVTNIISRNYDKNGYGGLFPLKFTKKDQRKVELCYQMAEYLDENYYVEK